MIVCVLITMHVRMYVEDVDHVKYVCTVAFMLITLITLHVRYRCRFLKRMIARTRTLHVRTSITLIMLITLIMYARLRACRFGGTRCVTVIDVEYIYIYIYIYIYM